MFLSPEKFALLIALASGIPILFIGFFSFLLFKQNNLRKKREIDIMNAMLQTQEEERKRIAQDLHDQIGPQLSGIKLLISTNRDNHPEKAIENISSAKRKLDEAITEIRNISHNLYSGNVAEIGLIESLKETIHGFENFNKQFILNFQIEENTLTYIQQINIYRICLELIYNSIKHSSGDTITLSMYDLNHFIHLDYSDNGKSNPNKSQSNGIGLKNIQNRVQLLGGETINFTQDYSQGAQYSFRFKYSV